ncbi:MAG: integrase [Hyphococcus sp.]|nr:MAG: integrase [Marinicaulis sp.]
MPSVKSKITKRTLKLIPENRDAEFFLWDTELKGFCVRAYKSGRSIYAVRYKRGYDQGWHKIADADVITPEQARKEARQLLAGVARGELPKPPAVDSGAPRTVAQLIDAFLAKGPIDRPDKRQSSWDNDKGYLNNHARPLLGKKPIKELKPSDIAKFQDDVLNGKSARQPINKKGRGVRGGRGAAVHAVRSLSAALGWAVDREWIDTNPVSRIKKMKDGSRERYLSKDETNRLMTAIDMLLEKEEITHDQIDILNLVALTGARRGEILALKWVEVDLERNLLLLPPARHKTGGVNHSKAIPLSAPASAILTKRNDANDQSPEFVFPSERSQSGHVEQIRHTWDKLKTCAKISNMTIHDFRHAYASFAINDGAALAHIGANLGHKRISTTERYAHLRTGVGSSVAETVGKTYLAARKQ